MIRRNFIASIASTVTAWFVPRGVKAAEDDSRIRLLINGVDVPFDPEKLLDVRLVVPSGGGVMGPIRIAIEVQGRGECLDVTGNNEQDEAFLFKSDGGVPWDESQGPRLRLTASHGFFKAAGAYLGEHGLMT